MSDPVEPVTPAPSAVPVSFDLPTVTTAAGSLTISSPDPASASSPELEPAEIVAKADAKATQPIPYPDGYGAGRKAE